MEALNSILTAISKLDGEHCSTTTLEELRVAAVNLIAELGKKCEEESKVVSRYSCEPEKRLQQWGEDQGLKSQLEISCKFSSHQTFRSRNNVFIFGMHDQECFRGKRETYIISGLSFGA